MKSIFYIFSLLFILPSCVAKYKVVIAGHYTLPTADDVVMYEVNPRIFASAESFKAIGK